MTLSLIDRFLLRPEHQEGESAFAFLTRLVDENELSSYARLATVLGTTPKRLTREVLGGTRSRSGLSPWADRSYARICPCCMESDGAIGLELWDLPLEMSCSTHQVLLIDVCPSCGIRISHDRPRFRSCICGFHFARAPATAAPAWLSLMRKTFSEAFCEDLPLEGRHNFQLALTAVLGWSRDGRCPAITKGEEPMIPRTRSSLAELAQFASSFQVGGTGLSEEFLADFMHVSQPVADAVTSVLRHFRLPMERAAKQREQFRSSQSGARHTALATQLPSSGTQVPGGATGEGLLPGGLAPDDEGDGDRAIAELHAKSRWQGFPSAVTLDEAAALEGLSVQAAKELFETVARSSKHVRVLGKGWVEGAEVAAFRAILAARAEKINARVQTADLITLAQALSFAAEKGAGSGVATFISVWWGKRLPLLTTGSQLVTAKNCYVPRNRFGAFAAGCRWTNHAALSHPYGSR